MSVSAPVEEASRCMKCGFCMSSCPVYAVDHMESHVARGRNMLVLSANRCEVPLEKSYREMLSYCLLCGCCQATCPANVPSAAITAQARANLVHQKGLTLPQRVIYRGIVKHRPVVARLLGLVARLPGMSAQEGKPLRHLADFVALFSRGLSVPRLSSPFLSRRIPLRTHPPPGVKAQGEVAVFPGCAYEFFFAHIGKDIILTLAEAGFEAVYSSRLTCCGLAVHSAGDASTARKIAQHNIEVLSEFDRIVTGCATCGFALKSYKEWFPHNDPWRSKAADISSRVEDLSEFLTSQGFQPKGSSRGDLKVTYHDPCHLRWHQGIDDAPREILGAMNGVEFVEMEGADTCCGLGGAFGLTHRDMSIAIQAKKMDAIKKTNADAVVTSCPGCMIQLMDGVRRHKLPLTVMHISELIQRHT